MPSTRSKASADVAEQVESALAEETKQEETEDVDQVAEDVKSESDSTTNSKSEADGGNADKTEDDANEKNSADDENSKGGEDEGEDGESKGEKRANDEEDEVSSAVKQCPAEKKAKLDSTEKPLTDSGDSNNEVAVEN